MSLYKEIKADIRFLQPGTRVYHKGSLNILVSPPHEGYGWHMSISTCYRNPTWEEIRDAWYALIPDSEKKNGAMFFPPQAEYVNLQQYCFHVHEVPLDCKTSSS